MLRYAIIILVLVSAAHASIELEAHRVTKAPLSEEQKKEQQARQRFQSAQTSPKAQLARSNEGLLLTGFKSSSRGMHVLVKNLTGSPKTFDSSRLVGHAVGNEYPAGAASGYVIKPGETAKIPIGFIGRGGGFVALSWKGSGVWISADGKLYASAADAVAVDNERLALARAKQNAMKLYKVSDGAVVQK